MRSLQKLLYVLLTVLPFLPGQVDSCRAATFESFLEPDKQIDLVPADRDTISAIHVQEGQHVSKGQVLVTLDRDILKARLVSAQTLAENRGRLDAAEVVVAMRKSQLENLEKLATTGHVRPKELEKARADLAIAKSDRLSAIEEKKLRKAEYQQVKTQLDKKEVRTPIDGIILKINRQVGELVGTGAQEPLVTIVKPYPLHAEFFIPLQHAQSLKKGQKLNLQTAPGGVEIPGEVEYISPVVDPESGTLRIRLVVEDARGLKSGIRCSLDLTDTQKLKTP